MRLFMQMIVSTRRRSTENVCDTEYWFVKQNGVAFYLEVYLIDVVESYLFLMQYNPQLMVNLMSLYEA
jgi:uncharacterized protein with PQ loop repeat